MKTDQPRPSSPLFEVEIAYRQRLERLVLRLLRKRFRSPRALWRMEVDLLNLQGEVQASISKRKAEPPTAELHEQIEALRNVRWHARRFGDALAWVFFQGERQMIYPLSENSAVPITPTGTRSQSLVAAAELLSPKLGFPLLHDVTDILRIGDVTFFQPPEAPRTVELKSTEIDRETEGDQVRVTYSMTAIWPGDGHSAPVPPPAELTMKQPALDSKRFHQQLARMSKAHGLRTAALGKPAKIDGQQHLMIESLPDDGPGHWETLRRLIRTAKRSRHASGPADSATFYHVMYKATGFQSNEDFTYTGLLANLIDSGIWLDDRSKNSLVISALADPRGKGAHRYLPYYLFPIPRTAIIDILQGRLVILSLLNVGRLNEALEAAGFSVEIDPKHWMPRVFTTAEIDGVAYRVQIANLHENVHEIIVEGRPVSSVVALYRSVARGAAEQVPGLIRERASA